MLSGMPPTSHPTCSNDNEARALTVCCPNLALPDVTRDELRGFRFRHRGPEFAVNFNDGFIRAKKGFDESLNFGDTRTINIRDVRPLPSLSFQRRKVIAHEVVDASRIHAR
jgi:hypothetical protein